jgi:hypothetical protein
MGDRKTIVFELAVARADLEELRVANLRRLIDARSALSIATVANLPRDFRIEGRK